MSDKTAEFLGTEHLAGDLQGRAVRGGITIFGVQTTKFALSLFSTAVLARLLAPRDFGLVAMAGTIGNFLGLFLEVGLGSATVQHPALVQAQVSALFWINSALGLLFAVLMSAAAPLAARFYGQHELIGVTTAMALGFVFGGLSVQHAALLRRQMRFGSLAGIELVSISVGIAAAVTSAVLGAGYWALVYLQVVPQAVAFASTWWACRWRPSRPRKAIGVRGLLSFGAGLTGFNLLTYLARNVDNIIIGRFAGTAELGLYMKSYSLLLLPVDRVRGPAAAVVVPALSRLQHDPVGFKDFFLKALTSITAVGMPLTMFMFVFAEEAVLLVLGRRWQGSVVFFQVLAPAAFVETFNTVGSWACAPFGRSDRLVRWQLFATGVTVGCILVGIRWGALGVAVAVSLSTVALRVPALFYLLRGSPVSPVEVLSALARPAGASIAAGVILAALRFAFHIKLGGALLVLVAAPVFGVLYLALWLVFPAGRHALSEVVRWFRDLAPRRTNAH